MIYFYRCFEVENYLLNFFNPDGCVVNVLAKKKKSILSEGHDVGVHLIPSAVEEFKSGLVTVY